MKTMPVVKNTCSFNAQTLQKMLMRVDLKAYFAALGKMFNDPVYYDVTYDKLLRYTALDEEFHYDFLGTSTVPITPDPTVTVGEMLRAATEMITRNGYDLSSLPPLKRERMIYHMEETAQLIVEEILVKPMIRLDTQNKAPSSANKNKTKGDNKYGYQSH